MAAADMMFDLPLFHYGAILADPPWYFKNFSAAGEEKNPVAHYDCMELDAIKALPVGHLARPDAALILWATAPMLPHAIDTLRAWGFRYVTAGTWGKQSSTGAKLAFGTGYVLRSAAEIYLVGFAGAPRLKSASVRNFILAPVREHSRKPDEIYALVEALFDGPYLELFARTQRPGWTAWGNQVGKFDAAASCEARSAQQDS